MRLYHMLNAKYGLEALRKRRLKIATIMELNDPFEFLGVDLADPMHSWAVRDTKRGLAQSQGLLCFSRTWTNPVLWSHYADRHRGMCLGFDLPRTFVRKVSYVARRPAIPSVVDQSFAKRLLFTKFSHWRYEQEFRSFVTLEEHEGGLYFMDFSDKLRLAEVTIGSESAVTRGAVAAAMGASGQTTIFQARAAASTFSIEREEAA